MSEILPSPELQTVPETQAHAQETQESYAGRLRRRLGEAGRGLYSLLDVTAGIALVSSDIKQVNTEMADLNEYHHGMLERRAAADVISAALEDDIRLDFRLQAQRAGYSDVATMPTELRRAVAEAAAHGRMAEIITELQAHHPGWAPEDLAEAAQESARDIAAILAFDEAEREDYQMAMFDYQELAADAADMQAEMEALRQQRRDHLARIGRAALKGLVSFGGKMRDLPVNAAAHATVTVQRVGNWYRGHEKSVKFTAIGLAIGGLTAYIGSRLTGVGHGSHMNLAANYTDYIPDQFSPANAAPQIPDSFVPSGHAPNIPAQFTPNAAPNIPDAFVPSGGAPNIPDSFEPATAPNIPDHFAPNGVDLAAATTSEQLFNGSDLVSTWPDTITVSKWDPTDKDGSLWGITTQMLHRSGVAHPSGTQIQHLVDALMPQANPDGTLNKGQTLDLRPAIDLLPRIS